MKIQSILECIKVKEIEITFDVYSNLSLSGKSDYVSALIRSFRENIKIHTESLEIYFRKNPINSTQLRDIEEEFNVWVEIVYETLSPFVSIDCIHEVFLFGPEIDDLITEYDTSERVSKEIPKDALLEYVARIRDFYKFSPLNQSTLNKLKTEPRLVINYFDDEENNDDLDFNEVDESFSEGIIIISGERIPLTYPFYSVAKHLEKFKAFSEERAISQNVIHEELKLPFKETRLKQWKKIKGKTNPVISKVFNTNSRGLIWLKKNAKTI
jgi:hypothetical protein